MRFKEYYTANSPLKVKLYSCAKMLINILTIPNPRQNEQKRAKAHDNTFEYWINKNSPIYQWLNSHGIQHPPGFLPPYAQGGAGTCYFLNDKVVKMSANRVEANVAKMIAGRKDLPTVILDVLKLSDNLYAILQEFVDTKNVPVEIKQAADYIAAGIIDEYPDMTGFPTDHDTQEKLCKAALVENGGDLKLMPSMLLMIKLLANLYSATGFKHDDATPTNLGLHQNKVVITDLGPNETGRFDSANALKQIEKNRETLGLPKHPNI